jgi:hypothetical protein
MIARYPAWLPLPLPARAWPLQPQRNLPAPPHFPAGFQLGELAAQLV